jgi:capsular polysaccharide transport system permease protein
MDELQAFQERVMQVDPHSFAAVRSQIQAGVEEELVDLEARLEVMRKNLSEDAPGVTQLKDRLAVVERQLASERIKSTTSNDGKSAAEVVNQFQKLTLESEFAKQAYHSALASLENARIEAIRQNLYLETFVRPQLAQTPEYPQALRNTFVVLILSFVAWSLGSLVVSAARHHV